MKRISRIASLLVMSTPALAQQTAQPLKSYLTSVQENSAATAADFERAKQIVLKDVDLVIGPSAAATMRVCLAAGYPHNTGTYNGLSRREVAECDSILIKVDREFAKNAAEKAKKDAEYNKKHPAK